MIGRIRKKRVTYVEIKRKRITTVSQLSNKRGREREVPIAQTGRGWWFWYTLSTWALNSGDARWWGSQYDDEVGGTQT